MGIDGKFFKIPTFNFSYNSDAKEMEKMGKAYIRIVKTKGMTYQTQIKLHKEGVFDIRATPIGATMVLLEIDVAKDVKDYINGSVGWVNSWRERLDTARMTVNTKVQDTINYSLRVNIDGNVFTIKFVEENGIQYWDQNEKKGEDEFFASNVSSVEEEEIDSVLLEQQLGELRREAHYKWGSQINGESNPMRSNSNFGLQETTALESPRKQRNQRTDSNLDEAQKDSRVSGFCVEQLKGLEVTATAKPLSPRLSSLSSPVKVGNESLATWNVWNRVKDLGVWAGTWMKSMSTDYSR
ncbi:hypothetical protein VNO78_25339 [Psophocarpus tetragonolobus]|uniref:Uncharacterized protein n=1 Tax=Psophocarpus tetragonolobus TaxID=3891 RepID=A0AAN9S7L9_PSOTE